VALACTMALWTMPARAQLADVRSAHEAYGPVTICFPQYAFRVGPLQGVLVMEEGAARQLRLILFDPLLGTVLIRAETGHDERKFKRTSETVPGLGTVERYDYPSQETAHSGIPGEGSVTGRERAHGEYVLPALGSGGPLRIETAVGPMPRGDLAPIVAGFIRRTPAVQCDSGLRDVSGGGGEVQSWSPEWTAGPAIVCSGTVLVALRAAERARHGWPYGGSTTWDLAGPGYRLSVFTAGFGNGGAGETGNLVKLGYTMKLGEGGLGELIPPPAKAKRLESVRFRYKGADSATLTQLVGRLELVKPGDRRCSAQEKKHG
jgi:hypothetical protein